MISRIALVSALLALAGCAAISQTETKIELTQDSTAAIRALVERNASSGGVIRTKRQRLAGEEVVVKASSLPAVFGEQVTYVTKGSQSIVQTLEDISLASGIPIRTAEIADLNRSTMPGQSNGDPLSGYVSVEYSGTARGLLDEIAGKANVTWRFSATTKAVEFFRYETRTLSVNVPAGAKTIAAGISLSGVSGGSGGAGGAPGAAGGSTGGGSSSAGNVSVSQTLTIDPWTSIMEGIKSILADGKRASSGQMQSAPLPVPPNGIAVGSSSGNMNSTSGGDGSAIANPELGLVTVTARPAVMERVARYVSSINARFSQNILIDVKIMSVTLNEQVSGGFNLNMLYNPIGKLGASIVGPGPLQAGTGAPGVLTLASKNPNSAWNGSTLVAQALSQFGKVSLQKQGQVLAVNGQPSPIQVANEFGYISGSSVTTAPNVGATTTQTQGTKVVGFTANFTPLILGDNRILLSYQLQISALAAPLTPNAQGIQTPNIASQSLPGQAFMRDGQAIVLFGYDEQRDAVDSAAHVAGYSKAITKDRQMMVIVVQVNTGVKDDQL